MTKGKVTQFIRTFITRDFYSAMLVLAVFCLLISSPQSNAAPKAEPVKPQAHQVAAKVNINQADAVAIAQVLKGIGVKKAEAIVAYRKANGKFKTVEQLLRVKGVGEGTLQKNKDKIVL